VICEIKSSEHLYVYFKIPFLTTLQLSLSQTESIDDNNIELQYELVMAFMIIQTSGWSHRDIRERRINDGYQSMATAVFYGIIFFW